MADSFHSARWTRLFPTHRSGRRAPRSRRYAAEDCSGATGRRRHVSPRACACVLFRLPMPDPAAAVTLANQRLQAGRPDVAEMLLRESLAGAAGARSPGRAEAEVLLARLTGARGHADEASALIGAALATPGAPSTLFGAGAAVL